MHALLGPGLLAIMLVMPTQNVVQAAEPFKDFTFRRVKPPQSGAKKLITIQIEQESEPEIPHVEAAFVATTAPTSDMTDWFWNGISPQLTAAGPGRFQDAIAHLSNAPAGAGLATPRLDIMRGIIKQHGRNILLATIGKKTSPALVLAMIGTESTGKMDAESSAGARGLMQLMPATATRFGVTDITDSAQNIQGGVAYMEWLLEKFDGDPILALAGYNAGENAIIKHDGVPLYAETRRYVPKVIAAFKLARALCITPPELFSDGCVFDLRESN